MPDAKQQVQCVDETSGHGYPHNSKAFTGVERAETEEINITQPEVAVLQDPSPDWREESIPAAVTTPAEERPSVVPQLSATSSPLTTPVGPNQGRTQLSGSVVQAPFETQQGFSPRQN